MNSNTGHIVNHDVFKNKKKVVLLTNVAEVIKYFKGEIPDWDEYKLWTLTDDVRVKKELYLKAIQLMEEAKHIEITDEDLN